MSTHTRTCTQSDTELPEASREGHIFFPTLDRALGRYIIVDGVKAGAQHTQLRSHLAKTHPQGNFLKRAEEEVRWSTTTQDKHFTFNVT